MSNGMLSSSKCQEIINKINLKTSYSVIIDINIIK